MKSISSLYFYILHICKVSFDFQLTFSIENIIKNIFIYKKLRRKLYNSIEANSNSIFKGYIHESRPHFIMRVLRAECFRGELSFAFQERTIQLFYSYFTVFRNLNICLPNFIRGNVLIL